jgi:glycosyltransferase involved in cell wall biosynthesis
MTLLVATFLGIFGIFLVLGWMLRVLQAGLGLRRLPDLRHPQWNTESEAWPRVSIIVPARNEEQGIEPALRSLVSLDYPGLEVIAINDRSTDRTGEILERVREQHSHHVRTIHVENLPPRWLGKTHALHTGVNEATGDWLLFTDADVIFQPDTLRRAIVCAEARAADHFILFPTMLTKTWGERMVSGLFGCMLVLAWGHSLWKVADPRARDYVGMGAFNLIRRTALQAIGGVAPLRMEIIEDMKLGKLVKQHGFSQQVAFGRDLITLHWAAGAMGMVRNLTKNFFAWVNYRWWLALTAVVGILLVNVTPFVGLVIAPGWARLGYAAAAVAIAAMYLDMKRYSHISPAYFFLHPLASFLMAYSLARSAVLTLWRGGVVWRGTKYPLAELRKGIV